MVRTSESSKEILRRAIQFRDKTRTLSLGAILHLLSGASFCSYVSAEDPGPASPRPPTVSTTITKKFDTGKARYIHSPKGIVRAGPSETYYETTRLPKGVSVDVYLETSDGWSGIRPPEGSHNWIPAQVAYLLPGGKSAEVIEEGAPAWIGSEQSGLSQMFWQTGLAKSQIVQIIGEDHQITEQGEKKLWYRIAPPQGEFRWVRTSTLADQPSSKSPEKDSSIKTASHTHENPEPALVVENGDIAAGDGEVVWSNEAEVLAEVNRQIRAEQSSMANEIPGGMDIVEEGDDASTVIDGAIEPIPMPVLSKSQMAKAKRRAAAAHQTDSFQHWDALKSSDNPKLKVGPVASILGLVGFSIVEAERKPTPLVSVQQRTHSPSGSYPMHESVPYLGPKAGSKLDYLPRPGRRTGFSSPATGHSDSYSHGDMHQPLDPNQPILSRLWNANQPVFGPTSAGSIPSPYTPSEYSRATATTSLLQNPSAPRWGEAPTRSEWHGFHSNQTQSIANALDQAFDEPLTEADFGTPEVKRAMLELSRIVSRPTEEWDLEYLRRQCGGWIDHGTSALVRGEARLLMERIERFELLRTRTLSTTNEGSMLAQQPGTRGSQNSLANPTNQQGILLASGQSTPGTNAPPIGVAPTVATPGEASGWLVQVHTTLPGQPEYALTDDVGNVISYVQSNGSVNLKRYLQQPVMVHGSRGYVPALASRQITAERVVRLR